MSHDACSNETRSGIVRGIVRRPLKMVLTGVEAGHPAGPLASGPLNHRRPDFTFGSGPLTPESNCVSLFHFGKTRHTCPPHG